MGFSRQEYEVVCHSFLQWITFCQTSPPWPAHLGWPHMAWLSFTELDKAVVLVWLDWLVFCDHGFSVSALWCPLAAPTILLGFLLPWALGISSRLLQQSAAAAPYLGRGRCSLPWTRSPLLTLNVGYLLSALLHLRRMPQKTLGIFVTVKMQHDIKGP